MQMIELNIFMNTYNKPGLLIIAFLLLFGTWGCRGPREVVPEVKPMTSADMALIEVHSNQTDFEWFSTRFSGSVLWGNQSHAIAGSMRIRKDSAIFISIAPILGIEIARAIVTPDSVKLVNRLESTYYLGDMKILSTMFNADLDFYMLQALLTGNDFPHFRMDQFMLSEDTQLLKLFADERARKSGEGQPIQQLLTVDPVTMRIRTNIMEQIPSGRALRADYKRYADVDGNWLPAEMQLMFSDDANTSNLEMNFNRTTINVPQNMQFSIPSRYTPINLAD